MKNYYKDSIEMMRLSSEIEKLNGVEKTNIMMATPSNLKLMQESGYFENASETGATTNDIIIGLKLGQVDKNIILQAINNLWNSDSVSSSISSDNISVPTTISDVLSEKPNFAVISIPGPYASAETMKALKNNMNVFLFSDNIPIEEEIELKQLAVKKNLLLMGPDCGTSILDGMPFGFANKIRRGKIGLVGASGTGLQQVSSLIDQYGEGVSHIIGVGGNDLTETVGGIMMLHGIEMLSKDSNTEVITLVSKAPSQKVAQIIFEKIKSIKKTFVVCFLGEYEPQIISNAYFVNTLLDAANYSIELLYGKQPSSSYVVNNFDINGWKKPESGQIEGLFSGGTFCREANLILSYLKRNGAENLKYNMIDLGDTKFNIGKPHPMIDPSTRQEYIITTAKNPNIKVIIIDIVLGYGSHSDPAGALIPSIQSAFQIANSENRELKIVAHVCGTLDDFQSLTKQEHLLESNGVLLTYNNAEAVITAAKLLGGCVQPNPTAPSRKKTLTQLNSNPLFDRFVGVNLGLKHFVSPLIEHGANIIHLNWKPPAEGDRETGKILAKIFSSQDNLGNQIDISNAKAIDLIRSARPMVIGCSVAKDVLPNFGKEKKILHAGAPLSWNMMCGPMKGSIIGAILYEGWTKNEKEAYDLASSGEIIFDSCHNYNAVGPMCGIISPSMPLIIVENSQPPYNKAFSTFNEGLGKVLRFGAYDETVISRLHWIKDTLAPSFDKAIKEVGKIDLCSITAQALTMGDESHNRNIAGTCLLFRILSPYIPMDVQQFLQKNDHFFLNFSMACSKAIMDSANNIPNCSIVTAMARNGVEFAIRLSGTGSEWFTDKAPMVKGLYFSGFNEDDANPDLGDSAITETCGIGGFAMAASPSIVKFVGGCASDSFNYTNQMRKICVATHPVYCIPSMDFKGTPIGIDARKVLDHNIAPVINTGIASKIAGVGQIGAGITRAPLNCFSKALTRLYNKINN